MAEITCPEDCTGVLNPVNFDPCATQHRESEIQYIFIALGNASPFTDVADPAEWAERLSQTGTPPEGSTTPVGDLIRRLTVIGDKPQPTTTTAAISLDRTVVTNKAHVLNWEFTEVNVANHDFMRQMECGGTYRIWYQTKGGLLFGADAGIYATSVLDMTLPRGIEGLQRYIGVTNWNSKFTEEFVESPLAA